MPARKDEAVASHPFWVARIVTQVARPDRKSHRGGAHGKPRVTRISLLYPVCGKETEGVDRPALKACADWRSRVEGIVCHVSTCLYEMPHFTIRKGAL